MKSSYALTEETERLAKQVYKSFLAPPLARLGRAKAPAPACLTQMMKRQERWFV